MAQARFDRNPKPGDARAALERIAASRQFKESRFSSSAYDGEPILRTGGELRDKGALRTTAAQRREAQGRTGSFERVERKAAQIQANGTATPLAAPSGQGVIQTASAQRQASERWSGGFASKGKHAGTGDSAPSQGSAPQSQGLGPRVIRTTASQREASERWSGGFETRPRVYGDEAIPPRGGGAAGARGTRGDAGMHDSRPSSAGAQVGARGSAGAQVGAREGGLVAGPARVVRAAGSGPRGDSRQAAPAQAPRKSRAYQMIHDLAQRDDLRYAPASKVFYEQARLLAGMESQADASVPFQSYFPTYQVMSDRQLNAYLAWRTAARKGVIAAPTPSFAFVYVYELLMGIGCEPGLPAYQAMRTFWDLWRESVADQPRLLDFYLRAWLSDYVVYHGLPVALFEELGAGSAGAKSDAAEVYAAVPVLREAEALALSGAHLEGDMAQRTFEAINRASSFRLTGSKFYKEHPAETIQVTCRVFERMAQHCGKRRKVGFVEGLFGQEVRRPHTMFYGAVFHEPQPHRDATYRMSDAESFVCRNNAWRHKLPCMEDSRSGELGLMLHAIDHEMRRVWEYPKQVQAYGGAQFMKNFVAKEAAAVHEQWQAAQVPQVKIDRSLLRGIRKAAVKTRESLLVDEERGEGLGFGAQGAEPSRADVRHGSAVAEAAACKAAHAPAGEEPSRAAAPQVSAAGPEARPTGGEDVRTAAGVPAPEASPTGSAGATASPAPAAPCGLTPAELAFVRALLAGDAAAARQAVGAGMLSLMVDSVNEKLFDELGDAAVEFAGEEPQLVEDYRPDIEALL